MDPMVIKYLVIATVAYGTHAFLAIVQLLLCIYLFASGTLLLSPKEKLGKRALFLGLVVNKNTGQRKWLGWLMITTGIAFILPLFGLTYWVAVIACGGALYCIHTLTNGMSDPEKKKSGNIVRKGLALSAILIFGFTIWEGRDLVGVGFDVNYKAIYWRHVEVTVWQHGNDPNVPMVGEVAPDFEITDLLEKKTVRLSDFREKKPVVLLFGSFT